jgi:hypothetical protein
VKTYIVYEIFWERCEYGGPSVSQGSSLHLTIEDALKYKAQREKRSKDWPNEDPFYYLGSDPKPTAVNKSKYKSLKGETK